MRRLGALTLAVGLLAVSFAIGQKTVVHVAAARFEPATAAKGDRVELVLEIRLDPTWHIYSIEDAVNTRRTAFSVVSKGFTLADGVKEPDLTIGFTSGEMSEYHEKKVVFRLPVVVETDRTGNLPVRGEMSFMACNEMGCRPPENVAFEAKLDVQAPAPNAGADSNVASGDLAKIVQEAIRVELEPLDERLRDIEGYVEPPIPLEAPEPPDWTPGDARLEPATVELRAGETARADLVFSTEDPAKIGALDDIFVDFDASESIDSIEAVAASSNEEKTEHRVTIEIRATDLAKSGDESRDLVLEVPFVIHGAEWEMNVTGGTVVAEFGLPALGPWILKAMIAALLALLTPCVFPMIPVTVSFFTKQAESKAGNAFFLPVLYVIGIVVSFVIIGSVFTVMMGAGGPQFLATNGWLQLAIGVLFVVFALSLFGVFTLRPPAFLMQKVGGVQGQQGVMGTLGMGLVFSLTSFTCTAPLVGLILVDAAESGEWQFPIVGMTVFASVLALPFFFLALFPRLLSKMPKAGGWMNSVKVTLGFLELAFAFKFIGAMDLDFGLGIFTRNVILWIWATIFVLNGLYLLGLFQFAHDVKPARIGAIAATLGVAFVLFGFHTKAVATDGKKLPTVLDSLLPPSTQAGDGGQLGWKNHTQNDLEAARALARDIGAPLFVDFTGFI